MTNRKPHAFDIKRIDIKDPEYISETPEHLRSQDFPGFPSVTLFVGRPGSGKTNVLMNLLLGKNFWFGFFDKIYLCGPTIENDKLYQNIDVPKDQIVTNQEEFLPKLEEWIEQQTQEVKRDPAKAPKCLFVFEDITSFYDTLQRTPAFTRCFNQIRHLKSSAVAMVHKLKAFNRTARMCAGHILAWPVNQTEVVQLYDDYGPVSMDKKQFSKMFDYATEEDVDSKKPFLYINMTVPERNRFRRNFTEILHVKDFSKQPKNQRTGVKDQGRGNRGVLEKRRASYIERMQRDRAS
jgi:hypothetical protein